MRKLLSELFTFIKNPTVEKDPNTDIQYRLKLFLRVLLICFCGGLVFTPLFVLFEEMGWVDMEKHASEELMKEFSKPMIFLLGAIIAPVIEELVFRGPLAFFSNNKSFRIAFYVFTILFGLVHITNFELTPTVLMLTPFLVAPQLFVGAIFGFIRTKFNLGWSMLLHGAYNGVLILMTFSELPIE